MRTPSESKKDVERSPLAWRAGMAAYRLGIGAFFRTGGLRWLRRKYDGVGIDERMGRISGAPHGGVWIHAVSVGEA
ncbi:MAG: hypothetical protein IJR14_01580, partial [Synergistaceae bacterium]|nr:hypothetical protein [Synergistaceae bacterium]